jgi:hypothetical protein
MLMSLFVYLQNGNVQRPLAKIRPNRQRYFLDDIAICVFYRLQAEQFSELLQSDALLFDRDILLCPTIKPERILASEPQIGRFLGNILRKTLLGGKVPSAVALAIRSAMIFSSEFPVSDSE